MEKFPPEKVDLVDRRLDVLLTEDCVDAEPFVVVLVPEELVLVFVSLMMLSAAERSRGSGGGDGLRPYAAWCISRSKSRDT